MELREMYEGARIAEKHLLDIDHATLTPELQTARVISIQSARRIQDSIEFIEAFYKELRQDFVEIIQSPHGFVQDTREE